MNTIEISEKKVPQIADISFVDESFSSRLGNINEMVQFDMMLDPTTDEQIKMIEIELPEGFGYPPVGTHDAC